MKLYSVTVMKAPDCDPRKNGTKYLACREVAEALVTMRELEGREVQLAVLNLRMPLSDVVIEMANDHNWLNSRPRKVLNV